MSALVKCMMCHGGRGIGCVVVVVDGNARIVVVVMAVTQE